MDWDRYLTANEELEKVLSEAPDGMTSLYERIEQGRPLMKTEEDLVLNAMKEVICANFGFSKWPWGGSFSQGARDGARLCEDVSDADAGAMDVSGAFPPSCDEGSPKERPRSPYPLDRPVLSLSRTPSVREED